MPLIFAVAAKVFLADRETVVEVFTSRLSHIFFHRRHLPLWH